MKAIHAESAQPVCETLDPSPENKSHEAVQCRSAQPTVLWASRYADLLITAEQFASMMSPQTAERLRRWMPYRAVPLLALKRPRNKVKAEAVLH